MTALLILAAVAAPFAIMLVGAYLFAIAERRNWAWLGLVGFMLALPGAVLLFLLAAAFGETKRGDPR